MLAILTTHPIQYQAPIWQALSRHGGLEFEVWYLSDQGVREGHDPGFGRSFHWDLNLLDGYPYRFVHPQSHTLDVSELGGICIRSLKPLLREKRARALWINGWQIPAYWQAAFQASALGIPVWLRAESNDLRRTRGLKGVARAALLRTLFRRVSRFLYIGSANKRLYQRHGVPREKLVPTPYCVDNERFAHAAMVCAPRREALRRAWGIPETATCFLFCGKFIPKKRPLDILLAAQELIAAERGIGREGRIHLLMAGDGDLREEITAMAREIEARCGRSVVTFAGFLNQTEIPQAYAASDCLLLPSDSGETWGLVVNEALASGRPAIVSDQCGCAEDLSLPMGPEFVFPCGRVSELADRMRRRLGRTASGDEGERCRTLAQLFGIDRTVATVQTIYDPAVRKPHPGVARPAVGRGGS